MLRPWQVGVYVKKKFFFFKKSKKPILVRYGG